MLVLTLLASGCRVVKSTAQLPVSAVGSVTQGKKDKAAVDPVELQQQLIRFADEFTAGFATGVEQLRRGTNALDRIELQKWKLSYASDTMAIASGQNAVANLLDMLVLATMARTAVEEHWLPKVYGESARPLLESCRDSEKKIWQIAAPVLKPEQAEELRRAIRTVFDQRGDPQIISHIRALGLAEKISKDTRPESGGHGPSVFSLLQLDPLAGLDPATREIAQGRLFAERALYVAQRMPLLVRWQTELLTYQLAATPEAANTLSNFDRFAQTADSITRLADQMPRLVNEQRDAGIKQVLEGLAAERTNLISSLAADEMQLKGTLTEVRQTLNAGNELMKSSDAAIKSLDSFLARFPKDTNAPTVVATNSRPFDILDYATAAKEVTATLKELNSAINSLDKSVPQLQKAGQDFESAGNRLLTRIFLLGAALILFLLVGAVTAALIYRRLAPKPAASDVAAEVTRRRSD
ncbi:MAG: hypothetical protein C5B50_17080 [Verrucomicrobia bacterium]|nr:MAG: hypothetical protein C5B50_17080 [Verrucomicrobiota bacterium]